MNANAETFCKVLVFAKAPIAGQVKTRLIPLLGAEGAAKLHEKLTLRALETASQARLGKVELWCAPTTRHVFFERCQKRFGVELRAQASGELGQRLSHAFQTSLSRARQVLIIGSDCPALTRAHLRRARRLLRAGHDAVIAPAQDGGYVLIGLKRFSPRLFQNINWGSRQVMRQTRKHLAGRNWRWHKMECLWDVDRPEDYLRFTRNEYS